jgi:hypothetical protein
MVNQTNRPLYFPTSPSQQLTNANKEYAEWMEQERKDRRNATIFAVAGGLGAGVLMHLAIYGATLPPNPFSGRGRARPARVVRADVNGDGYMDEIKVDANGEVGGWISTPSGEMALAGLYALDLMHQKGVSADRELRRHVQQFGRDVKEHGSFEAKKMLEERTKGLGDSVQLKKPKAFIDRF